MTADSIEEVVRDLGGTMCNCSPEKNGHLSMPLGPAGSCSWCDGQGPLYQQQLRHHQATRGEVAGAGALLTAGELDGDARPSGDEGVVLLDRLCSTLKTYVIMPTADHYIAVSLWVAATHAQPAWQHAPRLVAYSPEKQCGKSRLLDVIEATCHDPLLTVSISPAALVRSITDDPPTLLLDEADAVFGTRKAAEAHEDLRGILNAGHQRNRPYIRWDVGSRSLEKCPTFAFAALASIGALPDTIMDRAVVIPMKRRAPGEKVSPYRSRDAGPLRELGGEMGKWLQHHLADLEAAEPAVPVEDRAADTWLPLVAVADLAGGNWPGAARLACAALTTGRVSDTSAGIRLLTDIRAVFTDAEKLSTEALTARLCKLEESPWADWHGRNITPRDLAELLKPYGVHSVTVKIDGKTPRGYKRAALHDAWDRYLSTSGGSATSATSATAQVGGLPGVAGCTSDMQPDPAGCTSHVQPATPDVSLTSEVAQVAEVAEDPTVQEPTAAEAVALVLDKLGGSPWWPTAETGPCVRCSKPCHRYGDDGRPECGDCAGEG